MTIPFCKDCVHHSIDYSDNSHECRRFRKVIEFVAGTDASYTEHCWKERKGWWPHCGKKGRYFVAKDGK